MGHHRGRVDCRSDAVPSRWTSMLGRCERQPTDASASCNACGLLSRRAATCLNFDMWRIVPMTDAALYPSTPSHWTEPAETRHKPSPNPSRIPRRHQSQSWVRMHRSGEGRPGGRQRAAHACRPRGEPPPEKTYRLGILFVHGMGQQERGDTITQMGDALTEWLRRWLGNDRFSLRDATLRSRRRLRRGRPRRRHRAERTQPSS